MHLQVVKGCYRENNVCIRANEGMSKWFGVKAKVRQGYVYPHSYVHNIFMDGAVMEVLIDYIKVLYIT